MGNSTNAADVTLGTFVSILIVWQLGYWFPDMMASAPKMFSEALTGALIIVISYFTPNGTTEKLAKKAGIGLIAVLLIGCTQMAQIPVVKHLVPVDACAQHYEDALEANYCRASVAITAEFKTIIRIANANTGNEELQQILKQRLERALNYQRQLFTGWDLIVDDPAQAEDTLNIIENYLEELAGG